MTSPNDFSDDRLEQSLSDYLDGALSNVERTEIEKLLHDDTGLMAQMSEMRYLRDSLKQVASRDSHVKLDQGFADRVLQAAVSRALDEGLSDDHPLILVAQQPTPQLPTKQAFWDSKTLGIIAGIAASIGLAVFLTPSSSSVEGDGRRTMVAEAELRTAEPELPDGALAAADSPILELPSVDVESDITTKDIESGSMIAANSAAGSAPLTLDAINRSADIPKAMQPTNGAIDATVAMNAKKNNATLSAIVVLDIRQTDSGRLAKAVRRAMRQANIQRPSEQPMTSDIANAAVKTVGVNSEEMVSLMYLQAPAKSIDQFYLNLFSDQEGIKSVSMALATDAPVLDLVRGSDINPETVRHESGLSTPLLDAADNAVDHINQLDFIPLTRKSAGAMTSNGPDFTAKLLVVIR